MPHTASPCSSEHRSEGTFRGTRLSKELAAQLRVRALADYGIMDSLPEECFDDIALLASTICGTPWAFVSFVDVTRQWFKAGATADNNETPIAHSFCARALQDPDNLLHIDDAQADPDFVDHPGVVGPPHIRFYAGMPIVNPDGVALGAVCAVDQTPRTLLPPQIEAMKALARQVSVLLEVRRTVADLRLTLVARDEALEDVKVLEGLLPVCAWCKRIRDEQYWRAADDYFTRHSDLRFTHGMCPSCFDTHGAVNAARA